VTARSTAVRDDALRKRLRVKYSRLKMPCGICFQDIDYSLAHPDPMSIVVDHVVPLGRGGADDASNCQPAHRSCNRTKSDRLPHELAQDGPRVFETWRTW
jgi:5-methylcytosine-specific restriction endonuclease McrA